MHHRRGRTTRREVKRMDDKSYRQAEARALRNGIEGDTPRSDSWGYRPEPLPLGDVPCNGKVHGKHKKGKRRDRCPVAGKHDWVHEVSEIRDFTYTKRGKYWSCQDCLALRKQSQYYWHTGPMTTCPTHLIKRYYTQKVKLSLCVECGVLRTKKLGEPDFEDGRRYWWNGRKLVLPKRPVKF